MFPQDRNLHGKVFGGILIRSVSRLRLETPRLYPSADTGTGVVSDSGPKQQSTYPRSRKASLKFSSELCSTNAALFASRPMRFLALDQITFRLPVPIGAVLRLTSKIVKTTRPTQGAISDEEVKVHIMVRAEVEDVKTGVSGQSYAGSWADCTSSPAEGRDQRVLLYNGKRGPRTTGQDSRATYLPRGDALSRGQAQTRSRR